MKRLIAFLIFCGAVFAQGQHPAQVVGTMGAVITAATTSFSVDSTGPKWAAFSWVPQANHTISKVRIMIHSVTGTIGAADMQLDIYNDSGTGSPGSLVSGCTSTTVTATPTAAAFVEWTGFTCAVTQFSQYWFVVKNPNTSGNAATWAMRYGSANSGLPLGVGSTNSSYGSLMINTTVNGSTWSQVSSSMAFLRVEYNDSGTITYAGNPINNLGPLDATNYVAQSHEMGSVFATGVVGYKVYGVATPCGKQSTPAGNLQIKVYQGASGTLTLLGTSNALAHGYFGTSASSACTFYFSTALTLAASTTFRVVMSNSGTDSSSIYYKGFPTTWDNDANSLALQPFGTSLKQTYCTGTCTTASNWTDTAGKYQPFLLLLNYAGEYVTPTGSGASSHFYIQ